MIKGNIAILLVLLMVGAMAYAADFNISEESISPTSADYLYPSKTATISWDVNNFTDPGSVDFNLYYSTVKSAATNKIADVNAADVCTSPNMSTTVSCSYVWTLPTGLDGNFFVDINATAAHDVNYLASSSGSFRMDTNACTTVHSVTEGTVTLTALCTGLSDTMGTTTIHYGTTRTGQCPVGYQTYTAPFTKTFGEHTVCYYSSDGLGNNETVQGFTQTYGASAYNVALLAELALAGLLLFVIAGALLYKDILSPQSMIGLIVVAAITVLAIVIFGTIL